ncbi:hypothetical protein PENTCL1PPCAC_30365, partial [Pristionchus entomophagus]
HLDRRRNRIIPLQLHFKSLIPDHFSGFPFSASTPCDFFRATDKGKRIKAKVILLEANSCCDHLIIYDGNLGGGILANITGEVRNETYITSSSNLMRVSWQPNGGV